MKQQRGAFPDRLENWLFKLPPWLVMTAGAVSYVGIEWFQRTRIAPASNAVLSVATSVYAPLTLALFVAVAVALFIYRGRRFQSLEQQTGLDSLRSLHPKQFEHLVAEVYERLGCSASCPINEGPDGGVDVVLKKAGRTSLVQCKQWRDWTVGVKVVREMFGVLHHEGADEVIIVTTGRFSDDAESFVRGKPIQLIDGGRLWAMVREVQQGGTFDPAPECDFVLSAPLCPKCGGAMKIRRSAKGRSAGQKFWGCLGWPGCGGSTSIAPAREGSEARGAKPENLIEHA